MNIYYLTTQRHFKTVSNTNNHILSWKSKRWSDESIKPPSTSTNILNLSLNYFVIKTRLEFKESCLKQDKISFNHGKIVNISSYPALENCLFGAVKLTRHPDNDQYKYSGDKISFNHGKIINISSYPALENLFVWCS